MSYLDPYGSNTDPRSWERDEPPGWGGPTGPISPAWPGRGDDAQPRARHAGAAPESYAEHPGYPHPEDATDGSNGYVGPDGGYPYAGPGGPYPGSGGSADSYPGSGDPYPGPGDPYASPGGSADPYQRSGERSDWLPNGVSAYPLGGVDHGGAGAPTEADPSGWPPTDPAPPGRRPRVGRRRASRSRPATAPAQPGRAGRNLPAAISVGLGLATLVVAPLFLLRPAFLAVVAVAVGVGIWEMVRAVRRSGAHPPLVPLIAGGVLMVGLAWWAGPDALSLGLLITVLAAMVWRLGDGPAGYQRDITATALIAVYVPFLGGFAAMLGVPGDGDLRVVVTLAAVVLSDTGGYAAGVWLGRHPMAPSVSPKKSWEGFGGSVLAAGLGSALLLWLLLDVAPWWGAVFGLAIAGVSVLGDLAESMIKRDLGIKDMSNLLPGHGGLMDRLDSVLFAVPTAYLLLAIFAPTG